MELLNETNGIVEQNQWIRSTISMDLFQQTAKMTALFWCFARGKTTKWRQQNRRTGKTPLLLDSAETKVLLSGAMRSI
ncbi:MAG: hypothetical protein IKH22_11625 [Prevotella sp.]|nr:hypothetical protein [Prevotella sp.]